jgi:Sulfotransferase family
VGCISNPKNEDDNNIKQQHAAANNFCRLEFVHIPKTGGTAIELAGIVANISWGACRFFDTVWVNARTKTNCPAAEQLAAAGLSPRRHGKMNQKLLLLRNHTHSNNINNHLPQLPRGAKVNDFHLPPHYFFQQQDNNKLQLLNPYHDAALFAIVRNPYEKVISEYYHIKGERKHHDIDNTALADDANNSRGVHDAAVMNRWLDAHLAPMMKMMLDVYNTTTTTTTATTSTESPQTIIHGAAVYYQRDGHFIPQYDYIFDNAQPQPHNSRRVVHHVLHFEHLHADFAKLMAAYNLSTVVSLPDPDQQQQQQPQQQISKQQPSDGLVVVVVVARKTRNKKLNRYNLTLDNIRRIETIYARDFANFGYPTISSEVEKKKQQQS